MRSTRVILLVIFLSLTMSITIAGCGVRDRRLRDGATGFAFGADIDGCLAKSSLAGEWKIISGDEATDLPGIPRVGASVTALVGNGQSDAADYIGVYTLPSVAIARLVEKRVRAGNGVEDSIVGDGGEGEPILNGNVIVTGIPRGDDLNGKEWKPIGVCIDKALSKHQESAERPVHPCASVPRVGDLSYLAATSKSSCEEVGEKVAVALRDRSPLAKSFGDEGNDYVDFALCCGKLLGVVYEPESGQTIILGLSM